MPYLQPGRLGAHIRRWLQLSERPGSPPPARLRHDAEPTCPRLAGLLACGPELTLMHAPYANSYRRLQPGNFAPVNATWGWDTRICMVRVVGRGQRWVTRHPMATMTIHVVPGADHRLRTGADPVPGAHHPAYLCGWINSAADRTRAG